MRQAVQVQAQAQQQCLTSLDARGVNPARGPAACASLKGTRFRSGIGHGRALAETPGAIARMVRRRSAEAYFPL